MSLYNAKVSDLNLIILPPKERFSAFFPLLYMLLYIYDEGLYFTWYDILHLLLS